MIKYQTSRLAHDSKIITNIPIDKGFLVRGDVAIVNVRHSHPRSTATGMSSYFIYNSDLSFLLFLSFRQIKSMMEC